jgi:uncharacterized protein YceK
LAGDTGGVAQLWIVRLLNMRSLIIILLFVIALLTLTSGCYSCYTLTNPQPAKPGYYAKRLFLDADAYDKRCLYVTIFLPATNSVALTVFPAESTLVDKQRHQYRLNFEPEGQDAQPFNGLFQRTYVVTAYGPIPMMSQHTFSSDSYDISVAYEANGERDKMEMPFVIHRYSLPFFIVWLGWLKEGPP